MAKSRIRKRSKRRAKPPLYQPTTQQLASMEMPRPDSNSRVVFILVPHFREGFPKALIPRTPAGGSGRYLFTFVLSIPGKEAFRNELNIGRIMASGDSLLFVGPDLQLEIASKENPDVAMTLGVNKQGRLATVRIPVLASSFEHAQRIAYDNVMAVLSEISFRFDVALDVAGHEAVEEKTEVRWYVFGLVGKVKTFDSEFQLNLDPERGRLLASYREGLNSTNVFYQALSFYKVGEGVRALRKRQSRKAKGASVDTNPVEAFSADINELAIENEAAKEVFQRYLGKPFFDALDDLKEQIRHAIAHLAYLDDVIDHDRYDDVSRCLRAIPVLKYVARTMLENYIRDGLTNNLTTAA